MDQAFLEADVFRVAEPPVGRHSRLIALQDLQIGPAAALRPRPPRQPPYDGCREPLTAVRRHGRVSALTGTGVSMSATANIAEWMLWALHVLTDSYDAPGGMWFNPGYLMQLDTRAMAPSDGVAGESAEWRLAVGRLTDSGLEDEALVAAAQSRQDGMPIISPTARTAAGAGEGVYSLEGADPIAATRIARYAVERAYQRVAIILPSSDASIVRMCRPARTSWPPTTA